MAMALALAGSDTLARTPARPMWQAVVDEFTARGVALTVPDVAPPVPPVTIAGVEMDDLIALCAVIGSAAAAVGLPAPDLPARDAAAPAPPARRRTVMGRVLAGVADVTDPYQPWNRPVDPPRNVEADVLLSAASAWPLRYPAPIVPFADVAVPVPFAGTVVLSVPSPYDERTSVISAQAAAATLEDIASFLAIPADLLHGVGDAQAVLEEAARHADPGTRWADYPEASYFVVTLLPLYRAAVAAGAPVLLG
ncbi:MAG TPA: hypothetical protein VGP02_03725 [Mycobacteriales bacterium]|jgi:hypothetical protein|nr:hypothetical protein [Mycobacteriales bacterium]